MSKNKDKKINDSDLLYVMIQQRKKLSKYVQHWLKKTNYDADIDYHQFTSFIKDTFGISFNDELFKWDISKSAIMEMEVETIKEINKYITSYNKLIQSKVELKMPRITQQCIDIYKTMNAEIQILKEENRLLREENKLLKEENQKLRLMLEKVLVILQKHGINVEF
ncbi:hypothetical protein [Spiroplasma culicicola]|uniref:Uncharacterized protein n=1 Tax=Spiroplasma culicicola AES-1 TaxID=1276246 RepID=W6AHU6_9MOLU|nr:hypothetical protein [Spiroplasma culicicola]AHI53264.1 hypothetical protein SCULI_v1c09240 [Spiroplasma culicicola AES-1]